MNLERIPTLIERAVRDKRFRAALVSGEVTLDGAQMAVVEESPHHVFLVIPTGELNSEGPVTPLVRKAQHDPAFRRRLVAEPRSVLGATFGIALADEVEVTVLEDTAQRVHVVLPMPFDADIDEARCADAPDEPDPDNPDDPEGVLTINWDCPVDSDNCTEMTACTLHCSQVPCDPTEDQPPTG